MSKCPICESDTDKILNVKEMVQGTREIFRYGLCSECHTLFLLPEDIPSNLAKYYEDYDALSSANTLNIKEWKKKIKNIFIYPYYRYLMLNNNLISKAIYSIVEQRLSLGLRALIGVIPSLDAQILDIGSGSGSLVQTLVEFGFINTIGCDPFIDADIVFKNGAKILKKDLPSMTGKFDLITLNHSFEHFPNPFEAAAKIDELLKVGGICILRFPNFDSIEFRKFQENWWGFHAPRHFFIYSRKSLEIIFNKTNLSIYNSYCESQWFNYVHSYEYSLDIDHRSSISAANGGGLWINEDITYWSKKAKRANEKLVGDWIVYYLRKDR